MNLALTILRQMGTIVLMTLVGMVLILGVFGLLAWIVWATHP